MLELHRLHAQASIDDGAGYGGEEGSGPVGELPGLLWLGLLVRFGDMDGFTPEADWMEAASEAVVGSWGHDAATSGSSGIVAAPAAVWQAAPAAQFSAWLGAVGRLQHEPVYLPGWPGQVLARLLDLLGEMNGHELSVALLGVAHQQQMAELAGALLLGSSSSSSSMLAALDAVRPQLVATAEASSWQHMQLMDAADLATTAHAFQQLGHTPAPTWVAAWTASVAHHLPGCSALAAVWQLVALAGFSAKPSADLLQGLVSRCQAGVAELQLQELLGLLRALQLLGYRPEAALLTDVVRAGQAAAARARGDAGWQLQRQMLGELQQLAVLWADAGM
jgi:hypothetical protein